MSEVVSSKRQYRDKRSNKLAWFSLLIWYATVVAILYNPTWVFVAVVVPILVVVQAGMFLYVQDLTPREVCQNNPTFWDKFWLIIGLLLTIAGGVMMYFVLKPDKK